MEGTLPLRQVRYENKLISGGANELNAELAKENAEGWRAIGSPVALSGHYLAITLERAVDELVPDDTAVMVDDEDDAVAPAAAA
jgi:hypothetical protein